MARNRRSQQPNTYAVIARTAAAIAATGSPIKAWAEAARRAFPDKEPSQKKACPRGAFLGICGTGWLPGIAAGEYNRPNNKNARYAVAAIQLLAAHPEWDRVTPAELWARLRATGIEMPVRHNGQMDVALTLWRHVIDRGRVPQSGL